MKKAAEDTKARPGGHPVRAIVFDYGNVIARFDVRRYLESIAPYSALNFGELRLAMKQSSGLMHAYEEGDVSSGEFYRRVREVCSLSVGWDEFVHAYVNIFTPISSTQQLIRILKPSYRLGLLSNTSELHFRHEIERNAVFPLFEAVTLSFRVGARKPVERIYRDMLQQLGVAPRNCIYIDDIPEFAEAAGQIGMMGIHYTTDDALVRSLVKHGVVIPPR